METRKRKDFKLGSRLLVLLFMMGVGLIITSIIFLLTDNGHMLTLLTLQDVLVFILPAVVTMALFYYRPLHVMGFDKAPDWMSLAIIVLFYIISLPGMNWLVNINEAMTLPSWMSGIEQWMRASEDEAAAATQGLLDIHTFGQLLVSLFVIAFMAGLSEEALFRGAMLRTMQDSRLGTHAVVWITAIAFSAIHMQFYGFVPRLVLGLWLGYLFVWTGSLWVPIIAHTLNNSAVVLFSYLGNKGIVPEDYGDNLGIPVDGGFPWLAILSIIASIALAIYFRHLSHKRNTVMNNYY